jgi:Fe-S oxidoreductase
MQERCSNCLNCRWIPFDKVKSQRFGENCPSIGYYNFNTYSARGRFQLGQTLLDGDAELSSTVTEVIHSCTSCGLCDVSCKVCRYNLEPAEHNIALKAYAVEQGKTLPAQGEIVEALRTQKTMLRGRKTVDRGNWADGIEVKNVLKEPAEVLFFPGCKFAYEDELKASAAAALRILLKAGVDVGILGPADKCCAGRAHQMGFTGDFEAAANTNIRNFESAGVNTIVTPCSDCYHAFKRLYPQLGSTVNVLHTVEYFEKLIDEGKLTFTKRVPMTVTYHDPCHLGRLGEPYVAWEGKEKKILNQIHTWEPPRPRYNGAYGVYDAPRRVLEAIPGLELVEMERIREYSFCCGAGGGCSETLPEYSAWTAGERITEANATGADGLVTACGWCEANFRDAQDEHGRKITVLDITDLVERAL